MVHALGFLITMLLGLKLHTSLCRLPHGRSKLFSQRMRSYRKLQYDISIMSHHSVYALGAQFLFLVLPLHDGVTSTTAFFRDQLKLPSAEAPC